LTGIPSSRIVIGGFSQGGCVALYTAIKSSLNFAGVLAMSTFLPFFDRFSTHSTKNNVKTQFLVCHDNNDPVVPYEWAKLSVKSLKLMGFENIKFKSYDDVAHTFSVEVFFFLNNKNFNKLVLF
jgi:predicted esterase